MEAAALENLTPEEESKALVRDEYERLVAQSDFFGWTLRLVDAGDFYVVFVRIVAGGDRAFVLKLECDDYWQIAPLSGFIAPELFEAADENTAFNPDSYPSGSEIHLDRGLWVPQTRSAASVGPCAVGEGGVTRGCSSG